MKATTGNFFLIGLMGSGKTTVGRQLARLTGKTFYDSDHEIETRTGVSIPHIFDVEGEAGFRVRERDIIAELTQHTHIVLATGGGAILTPENQSALTQRGFVIYLRAQLDDLVRRTQYDRNRPLLRTPNPRATLEKLYLERDPIYHRMADIIVDTSRQSVSHLVQRLLQQLPHSPLP